MPRPPILPVPDRKAIFTNGTTYKQWLASPDAPEDRASIEKFTSFISLSNTVCSQLAALERPVKVIAIAETWCGDVQKHVPLLIKMIEQTNGKAEINFISRDQAPDFFIRFLTNGGEALPKFIFCNESFTEVGNWGPMPETPKRYIAEGKAVGDVGSARKKVSTFYKENNFAEATEELLALLTRASLSSLP